MHKKMILLLAFGLLATGGCLIGMDEEVTQAQIEAEQLQFQIEAYEQRVRQALNNANMPQSMRTAWNSCCTITDQKYKLGALQQLEGRINLYEKKDPEVIKNKLLRAITFAEAASNKSDDFIDRLENLKAAVKDNNTKAQNQDIIDAIENLIIENEPVQTPFRGSPVKQLVSPRRTKAMGRARLNNIKTKQEIEKVPQSQLEKKGTPLKPLSPTHTPSGNGDTQQGAREPKSPEPTKRFSVHTIKNVRIVGCVAGLCIVGYGLYRYVKKSRYTAKTKEVENNAHVQEQITISI